ncbi:TolC family protein [Paraburkholderia sp. BCC1886]|uniref:TolC family protein n=1 Tax=Paraburkholderia sp. BCC1886 TaxID=2562670 RepID=UPI001182F08F|nr:TolC family protein [Paraburkholderia sp. BCC1886]
MNADTLARSSRRHARASTALISLYVLGALPLSAYGFDIFGTNSAVTSTPAGIFADAGSGRPCLFGPVGTPLTLSEAVDRALCGNPKTSQAWANVKVRAAAVGTAKSAYLPTLSASLQGGRDDTSTDVKNHPRLDSINRSNVYSTSVSANWVLYDFGGRKAGLDNAEALLAAAQAAQEALLQQMFSTVATDYYAAQSAAGKLAQAKIAEDLAHDSFTAASARVSRGIAAISDQLQTQTAWAQATFVRTEVEGEWLTALGTLASDMNLNPDHAIQLPDGEDGNTPADDFTETVAAMIDNAQRTHPSIAAAKARLNAAMASERQTRAEGLPVFSLAGKYSQNNQPASLGLGEPQFPATGRDWYVGVQVQIPLFEGFGRIYRTSAARSQTELQTSILDEVRQQIGLDVWKSYQALRTATQNSVNAATLVSVAAQSFEAARHRYAAGVGNILELLTAQKTLSEARQQRIHSLTEWRAARIHLASSLGRLNANDIRP